MAFKLPDAPALFAVFIVDGDHGRAHKLAHELRGAKVRPMRRLRCAFCRKTRWLRTGRQLRASGADAGSR